MESLISLDTLRYKKKVVYNAGVESSIDYAEPTTEKTNTVQLLFSPFGLPFVPIEVLGSDVGDIITDMTWTKDRNNPGGFLSVSITPDATVIKDIVKIIDRFTGNLYSKIWGSLGVDLEDLFKPMTLCQLWIDGYHVMTGTVRSCKRGMSVDDKSKMVSYDIVIDELGSIYTQNILSLDTIVADGMQKQIADAIKTAFDLVSQIKGVSVATGIQMLVEAFKVTTLAQRMTLSDGFPLFLRLITAPNPLGGIANLSYARNMIFDSSMFQLSGGDSFWDFLKNLIPNPWMEMYTESGGRTIVTEAIGAPTVMLPGFNYLIARSVPYSNPLIGTVNPVHLPSTLAFDLTAIQMLLGGDFIIITDDDISDKQLGYDSSNQSTVFHTRYASKGMSGAQDLTDKGIKSVGPLNPFASGGIGTFGIREMFQSIDCTSLTGLGTALSYSERIAKNKLGLPTQIMSKNALSNLLAVWFRNQSRFREGTVVLAKQKPWARPGMYCLYLPSLSGKKVENLRDIGIYYIDSLSQDRSIEDKAVTATTTLNLIRGVPLPATLAQSALLLFDFEILPPESGLADGEYKILKAARDAISLI